jgi:hypothetical protein
MDDAGHAVDIDFWIGEWEVFTADGDLLGRNTISPVLGTGAPAEHWRGAKSIEGRSLTAWDGGRMSRPFAATHGAAVRSWCRRQPSSGHRAVTLADRDVRCVWRGLGRSHWIVGIACSTRDGKRTWMRGG